MVSHEQFSILWQLFTPWLSTLNRAGFPDTLHLGYLVSHLRSRPRKIINRIHSTMSEFLINDDELTGLKGKVVVLTGKSHKSLPGWHRLAVYHDRYMVKAPRPRPRPGARGH